MDDDLCASDPKTRDLPSVRNIVMCQTRTHYRTLMHHIIDATRDTLGLTPHRVKSN